MNRPLLPLVLFLAGCPESVAGNETLTFIDLGAFTTDAEGRVAVPWEAPDGIVSTEVFCGPYGYDTLATADDVIDRDETIVYDSDAPSEGGLRVGFQDDVLPVLIPVSPVLEAAPGVWTLGLRVAADALPTTVHCGVLNRIGKIEAANSVDIHVVFVGVEAISDAMNAKSAGGDVSLQAALSGLNELWADLDLSIGSVRYTDFSGDVDTYANLEGGEEFGDLLRTASDDAELTFFLVAGFDLGDGGSRLGRAGGPPGLAGHGGTSKSGVVVNVANLVASPEEVALTMAHEGGHFLGLFHPTESDGSGVDPLADTPECADTDGDSVLTTAECTGSGTDNVMWVTPEVGTAIHFSADQAWVVARNPIVRPG